MNAFKPQWILLKKGDLIKFTELTFFMLLIITQYLFFIQKKYSIKFTKKTNKNININFFDCEKYKLKNS